MALLDISGEEVASKDLGGIYGSDRVLPLMCDVTDDASFRSCLERTRAYFGSLSVLINNAGIATNFFDDMKRAVAINLYSVMRGTELAAEIEGVKLIVNIASVAGLGPVGPTPVYAATKAGVVNFTRSLRWLHRERGIRVVAICPSWTLTPMVQSNLEAGLQELIASTPFGMMQPQQVAKALEFVIDDSSIAGGAVIAVTGDKGVRVVRFPKDVSGTESTSPPQPKL